MMKFATLAATAVAASVSAAAAQEMGENPSVGGAPMMADMTIVENASNAPNLSTLVAAVQHDLGSLGGAFVAERVERPEPAPVAMA